MVPTDGSDDFTAATEQPKPEPRKVDGPGLLKRIDAVESEIAGIHAEHSDNREVQKFYAQMRLVRTGVRKFFGAQTGRKSR